MTEELKEDMEVLQEKAEVEAEAEIEAMQDDIETTEETIEADQPGDRKKRPGFFAGLVMGIIATIVIGLIAGVLYRGYIMVHVADKGSFVLKFPYYEKLHGKESGKVDPVEIVRKLDEMQYLIDNKYYYDTQNVSKESEGMFMGLVYGLDNDAYSAYYSRENYEEEKKSWAGNYVGIGVTVTKDIETGGLLVSAVAANGPAKKAGIQAGDVILTANGVDLTTMDQNDAVGNVTGPEGSEVVITVKRGEDTLEFKLNRERIINQSVHGKKIDKTDIGYISINTFDQTTLSLFQETVDDMLENWDCRGLIVDLRNNAGGDMNICLDMIDGILGDDLPLPETEENASGPKGKVEIVQGKEENTLLLSVEDRHGNRGEYRAQDTWEIMVPVCVIVNGKSASASEIFAGVFQSYGYTVVGEKTFGKGIVQSVYNLSDGSAVKFTTDCYRLPNGDLIHGVGIEPDIKVEFKEFDGVTSDMVNYTKGEETPLDGDVQFETALQVIKDAIRKE